MILAPPMPSPIYDDQPFSGESYYHLSLREDTGTRRGSLGVCHDYFTVSLVSNLLFQQPKESYLVTSEGSKSEKLIHTH